MGFGMFSEAPHTRSIRPEVGISAILGMIFLCQTFPRNSQRFLGESSHIVGIIKWGVEYWDEPEESCGLSIKIQRE
jgi:hypothetical protein